MQMDGWTAATPMLIALHGWRQAQLTTMACLPPLECWRESEFVFRPQMAYYQVARVEFTGRRAGGSGWSRYSRSAVDALVSSNREVGVSKACRLKA